MYSVEIPKKLYEEAKKIGIDINEIVFTILTEKLKLDPKEIVKARLELAEKFLKEAEQYLEKGDSVQASEKIYKTVEECIKALAQYYDTPEYRKALKEDRWWIQLLGKTSRRIARQLNEPKIEYVWAIAYDLHVRGFHEAKYGVEDIQEDLKHAEWLLSYAKQIMLNHSGILSQNDNTK